METDSKIVISVPQHQKCLVRFQCQMAQETQHLKLDEQLVCKAVHYLHQNQGYGFYFVGLNPNIQSSIQLPIISSLMLTFEHQQSWWIQSVFVEPKSRRKGNFTKLFQQALNTAIQKGVQIIRLYAQKENQKAKLTYQKLGMHATGEIFYGFDMIYSKHKPFLNITGVHQVKIVDCNPKQNPTKKEFIDWQQLKQTMLSEADFFYILQNTGSHLNRSMWLYGKDDKLIGYCQYFYEFSDWRNGFMSYVNVLYVAKESIVPVDVIIKTFISRLLEDKDSLKTGAIRFIIRENQLQKVKSHIPNGAIQEYDVMGINL